MMYRHNDATVSSYFTYTPLSGAALINVILAWSVTFILACFLTFYLVHPEYELFFFGQRQINTISASGAFFPESIVFTAGLHVLSVLTTLFFTAVYTAYQAKIEDLSSADFSDDDDDAYDYGVEGLDNGPIERTNAGRENKVNGNGDGQLEAAARGSRTGNRYGGARRPGSPVGSPIGLNMAGIPTSRSQAQTPSVTFAMDIESSPGSSGGRRATFPTSSRSASPPSSSRRQAEMAAAQSPLSISIPREPRRRRWRRRRRRDGCCAYPNSKHQLNRWNDICWYIGMISTLFLFFTGSISLLIDYSYPHLVCAFIMFISVVLHILLFYWKVNRFFLERDVERLPDEVVGAQLDYCEIRQKIAVFLTLPVNLAAVVVGGVLYLGYFSDSYYVEVSTDHCRCRS
jgi:hypothetical protein